LPFARAAFASATTRILLERVFRGYAGIAFRQRYGYHALHERAPSDQSSRKRRCRKSAKPDWPKGSPSLKYSTWGNFDENLGFTFRIRLTSNRAARWATTRDFAGTLRGTGSRRYDHGIGRADRVQGQYRD
jgi:hypothetical protein